MTKLVTGATSPLVVVHPRLSLRSFVHRSGGGISSCYHAAGVSPDAAYWSSEFSSGPDIIYALPFHVPDGGTLDRVGLVVGTCYGGSGLARLGIYSSTDEEEVYPGSLLLDCGAVNMTSTGKQEITINQAVARDALYYLCVNFDANSQYWSYCRTFQMYGGNTFGGKDPSYYSSLSGRGVLTVSSTYGAFPSTFPASASADVYYIPGLYYRLSA